jgi:hypothetical protein
MTEPPAPEMGGDSSANVTLSLAQSLLKVYSKVTFNTAKGVPMDEAFRKARDLVTKQHGNWARTNVKLMDADTYAFEVSCSTCLKTFSYANPAGFWGTHSKKCKADPARPGQVFGLSESGAF